MSYEIKTIQVYQERLEDMDRRLKSVRLEMNKLVESYQLMNSEPLVHLAKHLSAGVIQLRWRLPGTQKYLELDNELSPIFSTLYEHKEGKYNIFYFEAKRVSLNADYGVFFAARKRYKMARNMAQAGMRLKHRVEAKIKDR